MLFNPFNFSQLQWLIAPLFIFGRYFTISLILFAVFYGWKRRAWFVRKIQQKFPAGSDYRREIGFSILTSLIFTLVSWFCLGTPLREHTRIYIDFSQYGILYLIVSIPIALFIHDTYFYWMHRLMHHPRLFRRIHLLHHRSVNPSPWAAYAFHPLEALLEAGIVPLLLFTLPLHPAAFFAIATLMLWFNVYGHLGYELFPQQIYNHPLGRWLNTSIYHNQHHELFHGNYSLYFTFWDRWCGTLREDSASKIEQVHRRIQAPAV